MAGSAASEATKRRRCSSIKAAVSAVTLAVEFGDL
jgi:hypothetical protein